MGTQRIEGERRSRRHSRGIPVDGALLRQARLDAGLTLGEIAGTEMSKQALHQFETGAARPTLPKLLLIAERLGLSPDAVRADRLDEREFRMADLDERRQHVELERLARSVVRDRAASPRAKANANYYLGRTLMYTAPRSAVQRARSAYKQFRRIGEHARAAEALDCEAGALYLMEDPSALYLAREALDAYRDCGGAEPRVEVRMLSNIATYLLGRSRYLEAISAYRDALDSAGSFRDLGRLAQIYHGLAVAFIHTGRAREGLELMDRAVQLSRTEHDLRGAAGARLARLENDYGVQLMHHGSLDRAEELIRAALDRYAEAGVEAELARSLLSMGELAHRRGLFDEAMDWTGRAIDLAEERHEVVALSVGYQQLGELYADRGDHDRFEAYFDRAIETLEEAGLPARVRECNARYLRVRDAIGPMNAPEAESHS